MKNKDKIRKVFQTFTILLFIFQFQQSVQKYFQYPVVEQTSRILVEDLPNPVVYVCHEGQFNQASARNNGYIFSPRFLSGIREKSNTISWSGKWGNSTFKDLEHILLDFNYSSVESKTLLRSTDLWNINGRKRTFLFPHGVCEEVENLQQFTEIQIVAI